MSGDIEDMRAYSRGYEDGRRSKDADHAAVAYRLSRLTFEGGSNENLHKIAYAIYPCATGWTCESAKGLRDRLIDLLGGVHDHCDSGRGCACGDSRAGDSGEHAEAMTYSPDSQESPNLANFGGDDAGKITITDELRKFATDPLLGYATQDMHKEVLAEIADHIDEQFGHIYHQQGAVLQSAISHLTEECNKLHAECDQLRAKLEEADAAIANWRVREKSFDAAQDKLDAIREALDGNR